MSSILGLVGSARPWGNSEIVVRQVLRSAQSEGADTRLVRLTSLLIKPCSGCMRCVIGGEPCSLEDDIEWLVAVINEAAGLVPAAPTYWLGPAAQIKLVLDRLLMVTGRVHEPLPPRRPAVTVATAGLEGWCGVALPFLNALVAAFGYVPVESLVAVAPGPGEVLLNDDLMARMSAAGRPLAREELEPAPPGCGVCPVCRCEAFVLQGAMARCPICGTKAVVDRGDCGVQLHFEPPTGPQRWTPEGLREHMVDWVQGTGPRYMALREEIKARRASLRQMQAEWLTPPCSSR